MDDSCLTFDELSISFQMPSGVIKVTNNVSLSVGSGEIVALVGESGSGKSVTGMAALGILADNAMVTGSIFLQGKDVLALNGKEARYVRGHEVSMIFQEPMTALNPVYTVGKQLLRKISYLTDIETSQRKDEALRLLSSVYLKDPHIIYEKYPHQLSGGQRQRVMIAMALCARPKFLIADEPTTALDVTVQAGILSLLKDIRDKFNMGILLITHDMGVVADAADKAVVMKNGVVVENNSVAEIFKNPNDEYTKKLLSSVPILGSSLDSETIEGETIVKDIVLEVKDVSVSYTKYSKKIDSRVLKDISFELHKGEMIGLVGESGSGKSTLGKTIIGLLSPCAGTVRINGNAVNYRNTALLKQVLSKVSMIFQDPMSSLNPRVTIWRNICNPLIWRGEKTSKNRLINKAAELLERVNISRDTLYKYPHELSGGQKQRVGIARALIIKPEIIVCDEPTSALDVTVQDQVISLFKELHEDFGFSSVFITHDLAVVEQLADTIIVLNQGNVIEINPTKSVLSNPVNEYTRKLIMSAPIPDPEVQRNRNILL